VCYTLFSGHNEARSILFLWENRP